MRLIDADKLLQKLENVYDTISNNPRLIGGKSIRALILNIKKYCKDEQYKIDPESLICSNCGAKMDLGEGEA